MVPLRLFLLTWNMGNAPAKACKGLFFLGHGSLITNFQGLDSLLQSHVNEDHENHKNSGNPPCDIICIGLQESTYSKPKSDQSENSNDCIEELIKYIENAIGPNFIMVYCFLAQSFLAYFQKWKKIAATLSTCTTSNVPVRKA